MAPKRKKNGSALSKSRTGDTGLALSEYGDDSGAGFEDVSQEDLIIPFINILQKGSPLVDEDAATYVPGAKAGMLMNSVTEELHPGQEGVIFIPVHKTHKFVEWVPRDQGGGFVAVYDPSDTMVMEARKGQAFGKAETPDGNDLVETFYMFGLLVEPDGSYNPSMIAFASTQISSYKRWMTQMRSIQTEDAGTGRRVTPPMFAHRFRIRTKNMKKKEFTWHGFSITFANEGDPKKSISAAMASRLSVDDELYQAARECRELVLAEDVKVAYETSGKGDGGDKEGDDF